MVILIYQFVDSLFYAHDPFGELISALHAVDIAKISMQLENALNRRNELSERDETDRNSKIFLEVMNEEGLFGIIYDGSLNIISH